MDSQPFTTASPRVQIDLSVLCRTVCSFSRVGGELRAGRNYRPAGTALSSTMCARADDGERAAGVGRPPVSLVGQTPAVKAAKAAESSGRAAQLVILVVRL